MDEEKKDLTEQSEDKKVEPVKEEAPKEEPVQPEEPNKVEQAKEPKEQTLKVECGLDYDKLAETIVRAKIKYDQIKDEEENPETQEEQNTDENPKKPCKCKAIWNLFKGVPDENLKLDDLIPSTAIKSLELISTIVRWFGTIGIVAIAILRLITLHWKEWADCLLGITIIFVTVSIALVLNLYAGLLKIISKKLTMEKDKNYIIAVFSAFSGFFALIVAVAALAIVIIGRFVSCQ